MPSNPKTHEELKAILAKVRFAYSKLSNADAKEAGRLSDLRKFTRKDKESLAALARKYL